jgi:hypothetical protein
LGSLKFAGGTPKDSQKEYILAPFKARQAIKPPVIDGSEDPGVWDNAVKYRFGYNLVNPKDQTFPKDQKINTAKEAFCLIKTLLRLHKEMMTIL